MPANWVLGKVWGLRILWFATEEWEENQGNLSGKSFREILQMSFKRLPKYCVNLGTKREISLIIYGYP
jgi:hypothetical protein